MQLKSEVKPGDAIHIYHMFGEPDYSDRDGIITYIDDMHQIHGTWGGLALNYDDDFEIIAKDW